MHKHNFAKGKVISECKNDKLWKNLIRKVPAPHPTPPFPFKKTEDLSLYHTSTPFFNFSDNPLQVEVFKIYFPPLKRGIWTMMFHMDVIWSSM